MVDQYNNAAESDAVTTDEVATDEIVPRPNTELDVGTAMLTTNDTSSSAGTANNTLFINNIKSSSSNRPATCNPFDVRHLLEDRPPSSEVASEDGELAPYCPVPISHPSSDVEDVPTSSTSKFKSTKSILRKPSFKKNKKKGIPSVMNAFVTILSCVCLLGCLPHSSASPFNVIPPPDLECNTVEFVDVDDTHRVAHHPMSKSRLPVVYGKCLPEEIQQSMVVQMDVSQDGSWYRLVTQEKMLLR